MQPLRILVVATKAPWPVVDGGRLVLHNTIEALGSAGHHIELVVPFLGAGEDRRRCAVTLGEICTPHLVDAGPRSFLGGALLGLRAGLPVTVARHALPAVDLKVAELVSSNNFDVVHAEQLHALPQLGAARERGLPIVHRAHNVESLLWSFAAQHRGSAARSLFALEARRMSAYEVRALETAACTVALTEVDRRILSGLVPGASIHTIAAPFAPELPADNHRLDGEPAVVTLASASWAPSRNAVEHLAADIWPTVRRSLPGAVLHVFGGWPQLDASPGVTSHPSPAASRTAFPAGAIALVPERHPTGVPMKALEAWARGLPLLVDGPTAEVLDAEDGRELVIARDATGYADALGRLMDVEGLKTQVVNGGRQALTERHAPVRIAERLERVYRWAMNQR